MGVFDNIIAKYIATVVGFYVVSRPFLDPSNARINSMSQSEMLEDYYKRFVFLFFFFLKKKKLKKK